MYPSATTDASAGRPYPTSGAFNFSRAAWSVLCTLLRATNTVATFIPRAAPATGAKSEVPVAFVCPPPRPCRPATATAGESHPDGLG